MQNILPSWGRTEVVSVNVNHKWSVGTSVSLSAIADLTVSIMFYNAEGQVGVSLRDVLTRIHAKKLCYEDCGDCEEPVTCQLAVCSRFKAVPWSRSWNTEMLLLEKRYAIAEITLDWGRKMSVPCSHFQSLAVTAARVCKRVRMHFSCPTSSEGGIY